MASQKDYPVVPVVDGKILAADDYQKLPVGVRAAIDQKVGQMQAEIEKSGRTIEKLGQQLHADIERLMNEAVLALVKKRLDPFRKDFKTRRPVLGNVTGGLSGPAIKPIALALVRQVVKSIHIPVIAMGGIMTAGDALEFLIAGATMVAVGTANFIDPRLPLEILAGIKRYLRENKMDDIRSLIGSLQGERA